jgi:hypothetical protein
MVDGWQKSTIRYYILLFCLTIFFIKTVNFILVNY